MSIPICRKPGGQGWLALIGGGEFSFGDTLEADRRWLDLAPEGPIGFIPTASGSEEYGGHFATYMDETFGREVRVVPIYRERDARRARNAERMEECAAIYLGGGITDQLLEVWQGSPAEAALDRCLEAGAVVVGIAAAAQAFGRRARSLLQRGGASIAGFDWLAGGVLEPNFDPGHDRRLRELLAEPEVTWGVGVPAGAAILLGPEGACELVGAVGMLSDREADVEILDPEEQ